MQRTLARIDVVGILLLATGLTALQIFLERGERENWFDSSFIVVTALVAAVMRSVPLPLMTAASSLFTLGRRVGGNVGYAFVASQVDHRAAFHRARLVDHVTPYDLNTSLRLDGLSGSFAASNGLPPGVVEANAVKLLDLTVNRHAAMMAYDDVFWMMGMLFLVSVPFLCLLGSGRQKKAPG